MFPSLLRILAIVFGVAFRWWLELLNVIDQIDGTSLDLVIGAAKVFTDNAQTDELNTAQKQDENRQRRVAENVYAQDYRAADQESCVKECDYNNEPAEIGPDPKRYGGERSEGIEGEIPKFPIAETRRALVSRSAFVGDLGLSESQPVKQPLHDAVTLAQASKCFDDTPVH